MTGPLSQSALPARAHCLEGLLVIHMSGEVALQGPLHKPLFANLPLEGLSRSFGLEQTLPSPKFPQVPALQKKGLCTTACPSLVGVTAHPFSPRQAAQAPEVTYEADEGSLWTLLLTNLGRCLGLTGSPASVSSHEPPGGPGEPGGARWEVTAALVSQWGLFVCRWTPAGAGC